VGQGTLFHFVLLLINIWDVRCSKDIRRPQI